MPTSRNLVLTAALVGARHAAASPNVAMEPSASMAVAQAVTREVAPVVDHLTNNEPWYRSRVTWGAIVSAGVPMVAALGIATDWIDPDQVAALIVAAISLGGGVMTLYGRFAARKPIGAAAG